MHLLEGLVPAGSCLGRRPNNQLSPLYDEIDRSVQLTLLYHRLGNSNPPGISNSYDVRFHRFFLPPLLSVQCNYNVRHLMSGAKRMGTEVRHSNFLSCNPSTPFQPKNSSPRPSRYAAWTETGGLYDNRWM